jgi:transcriptional regulator with XRE-family HTH domain
MLNSDDFCTRLDKYLAAEFSSNAGAAQALGVSRDTLRAYRTGQRPPGIEFLAALYRHSLAAGQPLDLTRLIMGDEAAGAESGAVSINVFFQKGSTCIIKE